MGRGGGSSSGSGHSFSGGSSGHSFSGGFSHSSSGSSHRSSGSSFSSGSSSHHSYHSGPTFINVGNHYGGGYSPRYSRGYGYRFSFWNFFKIVCIIIVIFIAFSWLSSGGSTSSSKYDTQIQREKLDSSALKVSSNYIQDDAKWLSNKSTVISGMKYFMEKTGVQPYLIIADNINGTKTKDESEIQAYMEDIYYKQFADEAHLILLFYEPYENDYGRFLDIGTAAATVVDQEAQNIMYNYIDKYYYEDLTDDEYFATIFTKTADTIMKKVTSKNDVAKARNFGIIVAIIILGTGVIVLLVFKAKAKEKEEAAKILNTKIPDIKDPDIEDLENKYK